MPSLKSKTRTSPVISTSALCNNLESALDTSYLINTFWQFAGPKHTVFMTRKVGSIPSNRLHISNLDLNLGFVTASYIRIGLDGVIVGYMFSTPYDMKVTPTFFSVGHHSLYGKETGKVQYRNETLKPILKLPGMLLTKYGELGVLGLSVNCISHNINSFLNMV